MRWLAAVLALLLLAASAKAFILGQRTYGTVAPPAPGVACTDPSLTLALCASTGSF